MSRLTKLELPRPDPLASAVGRICRRLTIDEPTLKLLRRASRNGGPEAWSTYGWALGIAEADGLPVGPLAVARSYEQALALGEPDSLCHLAAGLGYAGHFSRRRGVATEAWRHFQAAARLSPSNALPHLAVAAAAFASGRPDAAAAAINLAVAADDGLDWFRSPVAEAVAAASPWLGGRLIWLWPDRCASMVRFVLGSVGRQASLAAESGQDPARYLDRLDGLSRLLLRLDATTVWQAGLVGAAVHLNLRLAGELSDQTDLKDRLAAAEQALARLHTANLVHGDRYVAACCRQLRSALGGASSGLAMVVTGLLRGQRVKSPALLAVSGRAVAGAGAGIAAASLATGVVPNPLGLARRRWSERRLAIDEGNLARATLQDLIAIGDLSRPLPAAESPEAPAPGDLAAPEQPEA